MRRNNSYTEIRILIPLAAAFLTFLLLVLSVLKAGETFGALKRSAREVRPSSRRATRG